MLGSLLYQLILLLGLDGYLASKRFVWYRGLRRVNSDNWTDIQLKVGYYLLGRMMLNLLRSYTYAQMIDDLNDDTRDTVVLTNVDLDMLHFVRSGVNSLAQIEGWDTNSVADSALYRILKKRKIQISEDLMVKYGFIKSFATSSKISL
jgi:hypothetical protein